MPNANQTNPLHDPSTTSDVELFEFVDPVGGLPLSDPAVRARERRGRPDPADSDGSTNDRDPSRPH